MTVEAVSLLVFRNRGVGNQLTLLKGISTVTSTGSPKAAEPIEFGVTVTVAPEIATLVRYVSTVVERIHRKKPGI